MATEFTNEEIASLVSAFKDLNVKPKADSAEELKTWMQEYASAMGTAEIKREVDMVENTRPQFVTTTQFPKISNFYGDGKGGTSYDLWKYEVQCLFRDNRPNDSVLQAIRMSLRGEAGKVVMRLGPTASIDYILSKMDSVHGEVDQTEIILAKFYSARQESDEDVSSWSCRLEDILNLAITKGKVNFSDADSMLRSMFWSGLKQYLKNITGHLYERILDFDELRVAIRRVEKDCRQRSDEEKTIKKSIPAKSAVPEAASPIDELKGMVKQLATEVRQLKEKRPDSRAQYSSNQQPRYASYSQSSQYTYPRFNRPDHWQQDSTPERGRQQYPAPNTSPQRLSDTYRQKGVANDLDEEPICWRCGQMGHLQYGCRVQMDHQRRPLNFNKSTPRGRR